jgi:hypothetical protein
MPEALQGARHVPDLAALVWSACQVSTTLLFVDIAFCVMTVFCDPAASRLTDIAGVLQA